MIKCIAIDMDGTLLTATQQIPAGNIKAIADAKAQGIEVVIATGRSYQEATFVLKEAGVEVPIICVNGAEVRSIQGEVLSSNPLMKESARESAMCLIENGVYFEVYTNNGTFTTDSDIGVSIMVDIFMSANPDAPLDKVTKAAEVRFNKGLIKKIDSYDFLFEDNDYQIYKLLAFSFLENRLDTARKSLIELEGVNVTSSGYENLEITSLKAQKGIALEAFTKANGISLKETMAIGDNYNDLSMMKMAGRSVAMGNADEQIKEQCDIVTLTNEESGVAKAIRDIL
ncbi:Cof-type HAD-IIB family hydrolase [Mesobacillus harenae]|uniref:Cof-type HAD-IIB family hydrolase n=1 Tax=Mesobacillus harenae TaxID=2213203 RepID=UPI0015804D14|nr:Cof-type HAD-IIB family hydrolase [Mesobacillus harenae]